MEQGSWYIVITEEFANQMMDKCVANNCFNYAITLNDQYVTAYGALIIFPDEFAVFADGAPLETVYLTQNDFPQPPENI